MGVRRDAGGRVANAGPMRAVLTVFLPAFGFFTVFSVLWALASPIFSSPDENAHATKAVAAARGQLLGDSRPGVKHPVVDLPDSYRYSPGIVCFAFQPEVAADCGVELGSATGTDWFSNWVASYNPVYYLLVGWPSLVLDGTAGIYGMRVASALLSSALLALAATVAICGRSRSWMPAAVAFLAAPMVTYMAGSVTPQGLEIAAGAALWISLLRLIEWFGGTRENAANGRFLWFAVTVSAVLLATARALGPLWVLVLVAGAIAIGGWRPAMRVFTTASSYAWVAVVAVAGVFSVGWTLVGGSLSGQAEVGDAPLVDGGFLQGAWVMVRSTPRFLQEAMGVFGWLDTTLPGPVYWAFVAALALLVGLAGIASDRRGRWTVILAVAAALVVPVLVQALSISRTGLIWQGRYGLLLYLAVVFVAAWILSRRSALPPVVAPRATIAIAVALAAFHVAAFVFALRRYVIGEDDPITRMLAEPEWQPPLGWSSLVVVMVVVSAGFATWIIWLSRRGRRSGEPASIGAPA